MATVIKLTPLAKDGRAVTNPAFIFTKNITALDAATGKQTTQFPTAVSFMSVDEKVSGGNITKVYLFTQTPDQLITAINT